MDGIQTRCHRTHLSRLRARASGPGGGGDAPSGTSAGAMGGTPTGTAGGGAGAPGGVGGVPRAQAIPAAAASLHRSEDSVAGPIDPVIGRDALGDQARVQRIGAESMPQRQRFVGLVAVADLNRRRPLTRMFYARVVARAANGDR